MPASSSISELTVTCNQCGSASLERLDRKEYRCNHCGAITLISDNDADRIEKLLRDAFAKQQMYQPQTVHVGGFARPGEPVPRARVMLATGILVFGLLITALLFLNRPHRPYPGAGTGVSGGYVPPREIAPGELSLSPLQWIGSKDGPIPSGKYHALLYNHSGYTISVPEYGMTFFPDGLKGGTAIFSHDVSHLLPGEYTHVTFETLQMKEVDARYEVTNPPYIRSSDDELVRLPVEQPQLVRQEGRSEYEFVGLIRNTSKRTLSSASVGVVLYGPDHQLLGGSNGAISSLRPGEKAVVHTGIDVDAAAPEVRSYEYLVDGVLERRP